MTQAAVAEMVGVSGAMVSAFELGREYPNRGELRRWRGAVGLTGATIPKTYAEWVRSRRQELKFAPEGLARAAGLTLATILQLESGATEKPRRKTRSRIERALSVRPEAQAALLRKLGLDKLMPRSAPGDFERFATKIVACVHRAAWFAAVGRPGDGGIDGLVKRPDGIRIGVQAKRWQRAVSADTIEELVEALERRGLDRGVVATSSRFTASAVSAAMRAAIPIRLYDFEKLAVLSFRYGVALPEEAERRMAALRRQT